jgi:flagellar biosynthetic protein FliQ
MDAAQVMDIAREVLWVTLLVTGPILVVGLAAGLVIGLFQAVMQLHDQTVNFIPKIVLMLLAGVISLPWSMAHLLAYARSAFAVQ